MEWHMAELVDILDAFTTPLKVGWVVWLAWGVGQVFWYRHERRARAAAASRPSAAPVRRPFVSKPSGADRVITRTVTPEQVKTDQAPQIEPSSPDAVPAADNATGDQIGELDRFVADFEMNTRPRPGEPHNGEPFNAHVGG
jgi:hypothetical protein